MTETARKKALGLAQLAGSIEAARASVVESMEMAKRHNQTGVVLELESVIDRLFDIGRGVSAVAWETLKE